MNFYDLDTAPPEKAGRLAEIYHLWNDFRTTERLPTREDLSFEALKGWHSNIQLVDLGEDVMAPKINLILGDTYRRYWGSDTMYNLYIANNPDNIEHREKFYQSIECFMKGNYTFCHGMAPNADGSVARISWIDLPMGSGGMEITHVISALLPDDD